MRVLHIAQSPQGARPAGAQQAPQQRMVNLSAYGRPGGEPLTSEIAVQVPQMSLCTPHQVLLVMQLQQGQAGPYLCTGFYSMTVAL